ncbi:MAG: glycosyltransferase, partial [Isosphaeraceae bacterium]
RARHTLVVAGSLGTEKGAALRQRAESLGLREDVDFRLAGPVDDAALGSLYRKCAAFIFASKYEGFGLPLLEALACGAPVIGVRNSSQAEVVGSAGLLAEFSGPQELADALGRVLTDANLQQTLRQAGPERARNFTWERVADRTLAALGGESAGRQPSRGLSRRDRPRVAVFCSLPPGDDSDSAVQAARCMGPLAELVSVDVFHPPGMSSFLRFQAESFGGRCLDERLFHRFHELYPYDAVVRFGNDGSHTGVRPAAILTIPSVLVVQKSNIPVNAEKPDALVFRSSEAARMVQAVWPGFSGIQAVVPLGVEHRPEPCRTVDRIKARGKLGITDEGFCLGVFCQQNGPLSAALLESLDDLARKRGGSLVLVRTGGEPGLRFPSDGPGARRVRCWNRPNADELRSLAEAVDLAVCVGQDTPENDVYLSYLELLAVGTPAVATWLLADGPGEFARDDSGPEVDRAFQCSTLRQTLVELANDLEARRLQGEAGWRFVGRVHALPIVAEALATVIRQVVEAQRPVLDPQAHAGR